MPRSLSVYVVAFLLRWTIALLGSVGILAVIYHLGTDLSRHMREHLEEPWIREPWRMLRSDWSWRKSLPGATLATVLWFAATLLFGFYVTRYANYGHVYGSLGAAIALLFWLYLIHLEYVARYLTDSHVCWNFASHCKSSMASVLRVLFPLIECFVWQIVDRGQLLYWLT